MRSSRKRYNRDSAVPPDSLQNFQDTDNVNQNIEDQEAILPTKYLPDENDI